MLCPLGTGAILSDFAAHVARQPVILHNVMQPAFVLPFAAYVAGRVGARVTVTCDAISAVTDGHGLSMAKLFPNHAATLIVQMGGIIENQTALVTRATPSTEIWATLDRLAHRTYAPATEESRLLGAGAGLSDND